MRLTLALALSAAVVLAGCAAPSPERERERNEGPVLPDGAQGTPAPTARALQLDLTVDPTWVRPGELVNATATVPAGARVEWLLASRNPLRAEGAPAPLDTGRMAPGASADLSPARSGRYLLVGAGDANPPTLNVTVGFGAERAEVALRETSAGMRFEPAGPVALAPGGVLSIANAGEREVRVVERDYLDPLGVVGAAVSFAIPARFELGDYDLVALASADGATGEARERIVLDRRKPDERASWGPFRGEARAFEGQEALAEPGIHGFSTEHALRSLSVRFAVTGRTPVPAEASATLLLDGEEIAASATGAGGAIELADSPAGDYEVRLDVDSGVVVEYAIEVDARLRLVRPESFFSQP